MRLVKALMDMLPIRARQPRTDQPNLDRLPAVEAPAPLTSAREAAARADGGLLVSSADEVEKALDFLDGYLFREMVVMLRADGPEASGLYNYYQSRIQDGRRAMSPYDRVLVRYLVQHFADAQRIILHAGIGLGTLATALARLGFRVGGVEADHRRFKAASRLHGTLAENWPDAAARYDVIYGEFPTALKDTSWIGNSISPSNASTNCAWTRVWAMR